MKPKDSKPQDFTRLQTLPQKHENNKNLPRITRTITNYSVNSCSFVVNGKRDGGKKGGKKNGKKRN